MQNQLQRRDMLRALGLEGVSKLPAYGLPPIDICCGLRVSLKPQTPARVGRWGLPLRRMSHRIVIHCTCGKIIPAGRFSQHEQGLQHFADVLEQREPREDIAEIPPHRCKPWQGDIENGPPDVIEPYCYICGRRLRKLFVYGRTR